MFHTPNPVIEPAPEAYRDALRKVVDAAVAKGQVVIVGRASQTLLAQRRDVLHIRVIAPLDKRIAYVQRREGLNADEAQARIQSAYGEGSGICLRRDGSYTSDCSGGSCDYREQGSNYDTSSAYSVDVL